MNINIPQVRADIAAIPGDRVGMTKDQVEQLLAMAERGQHAERTLINLQAITVASVNGLARA